MWPTIIFHMVDTIISPFLVIVGRLLEQKELAKTLSIYLTLELLSLKSSTTMYKIDVKGFGVCQVRHVFMHI